MSQCHEVRSIYPLIVGWAKCAGLGHTALSRRALSFVPSAVKKQRCSALMSKSSYEGPTFRLSYDYMSPDASLDTKTYEALEQWPSVCCIPPC